MERFAWEVMIEDAKGCRRLAVVVGGKVRWEEWYETLARQAVGRDTDGFVSKARLKGGPRPKTINCVLCHEDAPVKPRGKVPLICSECRDYGLEAKMARGA